VEFDPFIDNIYLAVIIGIISVARTARLIIHDDFPPMTWLRARILAQYDEDSSWRGLWECPYCLCPYLAAGMVAWMYLSDLHWSWWLINGIWAGSYVAAMLYAYDEPE
jgi:hypothetical protein